MKRHIYSDLRINQGASWDLKHFSVTLYSTRGVGYGPLEHFERMFTYGRGWPITGVTEDRYYCNMYQEASLPIINEIPLIHGIQIISKVFLFSLNIFLLMF